MSGLTSRVFWASRRCRALGVMLEVLISLNTQASWRTSAHNLLQNVVLGSGERALGKAVCTALCITEKVMA